MLGQVLDYGTRHGDGFGSYGLIWYASGDASVFISFTNNIDRHRDALNQIVAHPDELIVCQTAATADVARALFAKLSDELMPARASSLGLGADGVDVILMPGHETLADDSKRVTATPSTSPSAPTRPAAPCSCASPALAPTTSAPGAADP
ncbi:MAG: hypothetical protein ABIR68_19690 [Ilumatobacteraceae bacterium]